MINQQSINKKINRLIDTLLNRLIELNWNYKKVADETGLSVSTVSEFFNKLRISKIDTVFLIAEALGMSIETIHLWND